MKISFLYKFFIDDILLDDFKKHIYSEVEYYKSQHAHKGSSINISTQEDFPFLFVKEYILKLCDYYLQDKLTSWELGYIADCIVLSESIIFKNDELPDYLNSLTDIEINGLLTPEKIAWVRKSVLLLD